MKKLNPRIKCADGISLSVQGNQYAYCSPRIDEVAKWNFYSMVEVGFIFDADGDDMVPPDSWEQYADGPSPSSVYGYVPTGMVEEFIADHGGEASTEVEGPNDRLIYIQVPHQRAPRALAFEDQGEFAAWLEKAVNPGFSYRAYTRAEWDEYVAENCNEAGDDDWVEWDQPGYDLFDQGCDSIIQIWRNESNRVLMPAEGTPGKVEAMLDSINDFHTHGTLRQDLVKEILAGNHGILQTHQRSATVNAIKEAVKLAGWS